MSERVVITRAGASVEDVARVARDGVRVELDADVDALVRRSRAIVEAHVHGEHLIYGLNTGLGHQRNERVPLETLMAYQEEMIVGHAGGTGDPLPDEDVRAMIFARLAGAARGGAGLHPDSMALLRELLNRRVHPVVPRQGSVGAADLMHLAAVAMVMIGRGHARVGDRVLPGTAALEAVGLAPYRPLPKEGLALLSANAASIGIGALVIRQAEIVATLADLAGALSLESYNGNPSPWRDDAVRAKPFAGQAAAGASMRAILAGSYVLDPANVVSVQDPLSLRVMPQVHGALRDQVTFARHAVEVELNSIGDNPMVCIGAADLISTGNFHPMTLALGFEALRVGIGHVGLLSERRMQKGLAAWFAAGNTSGDPALVDGRPTRPSDHEPAALAEAAPGRRRSHMSPLATYSAAADVAELRHLATPVTLHSPPLDLDVEDHATLAPTTVFLTRRSLDLLEEILAIEIVMAAAIVDARGVGPHGTGTAALLAAVDGALDALDADASTATAVAAVRAAAVSEAARTVAAARSGATTGEGSG